MCVCVCIRVREDADDVNGMIALLQALSLDVMGGLCKLLLPRTRTHMHAQRHTHTRTKRQETVWQKVGCGDIWFKRDEYDVK